MLEVNEPGGLEGLRKSLVFKLLYASKVWSKREPILCHLSLDLLHCQIHVTRKVHVCQLSWQYSSVDNSINGFCPGSVLRLIKPRRASVELWVPNLGITIIPFQSSYAKLYGGR